MPFRILLETYTVDDAAKTYTVHIERCTFPQWDGIEGTNNLAFPTENELNITTTEPIQDPKMGPFVPHPNWKRASAMMSQTTTPVPAFAQQKDTPDPQLRAAMVAFEKKEIEAGASLGQCLCHGGTDA
jgi:hypothetical protein